MTLEITSINSNRKLCRVSYVFFSCCIETIQKINQNKTGHSSQSVISVISKRPWTVYVRSAEVTLEIYVGMERKLSWLSFTFRSSVLNAKPLWMFYYRNDNTFEHTTVRAGVIKNHLTPHHIHGIQQCCVKRQQMDKWHEKDISER